jgi:dipeptidyl aminopeptidase/acylaminoacyl peptidase
MIRLGEIRLDQGLIYWSEMRPAEAGRNLVQCQTPTGQTLEITPTAFNVRTRVHEYGGGAYTVAEGIVYFSNFADQRLYAQSIETKPRPLTPATPLCFADAVVDRQRHRLICVREDHTQSDQEPVNTIVAIDLSPAATSVTDGGQILVSGSDFYAAPRLSPDGSKLAWLCWQHPNMPWDGTELWVGEFNPDGSLGQTQKIAGGVSESVFQPEWSPDGNLYFISDRTGWWNLYRCQPQISEETAPAPTLEALCPKSAEFGLPQWGLGMTTYGFESADALLCTYLEAGKQHFVRLHTRDLTVEEITLPYASIYGLQVDAEQAVFIAASTTAPSAIARLHLKTGKVEELRRSSEIQIDPGYLSHPQAIEFPTSNGLTAFAYYYAPKNQDYFAAPSEKPPLLVKSHGGPTAATSASFNLSIQYWTSRGIAVLDVNYGGSTGYGREYRERLKGNWGIVDVDDCVNGAKFLVEQGWVDGDRLCIDGGSAGGYTTLAALTFRDTFKAGASYYGVSDLAALAKDTHKFESRYLDSLIGPYPERQDLYRARSPIYAVDQLSCPLIFFQGDEDKVVPPNQAEMMVDALKAKRLPVAYVLFAGEQHGFRKAENIKRALDSELFFYAKVFGFELADPVEPVAIDHL